MEIKNVERILKQKLGYCIQNNKKYIDHKVIFTNKLNHTGFASLLVFFDCKISDTQLKKYHEQGRKLCRGEFLDPFVKVEFYGMKVLVFS